MKKYLTFITAALSITAVQSQEITHADAMRYAQDNLNGTARFRGMSGAFGALGGDFSSLNVNPAGSAVFNNNQVAFTLNNYNTKNESTYFGIKNTETNAAIDLNQAGAIFVFKNDDDKSDWKKLTVGLNYENTNNYNNSIFYSGTNPTNSIDKYFLYYANQGGGISVNDLNEGYNYLGSFYGFGAQQAFLGFETDIIRTADNYDENTNRNYVSLVPAGGNYVQKNYFESAGYNGKVTFNVAAQYKDWLYLGLNLNTHFTDYRQISTFHETNSNNTVSGVQEIYFDNELTTYGNGFSFQLGAIAKVSKGLRLGLAYESPTWYEFYDRLSQGVTAYSNAASAELPGNFVYPNDGVPTEYAPYTLQTPGKGTFSVAYVFGKTGLLSIDYAVKDYSNTKFRPKEDFRDINNQMTDILDLSSELRIGGEYKIKQWSLRGGYRMEQSPYQNGRTMGDLTGFSAGLGYNFGSTRLDAAFSHAERDVQKQAFYNGLTDSANINTISDNVTVTLTFEL